MEVLITRHQIPTQKYLVIGTNPKNYIHMIDVVIHISLFEHYL